MANEKSFRLEGGGLWAKELKAGGQMLSGYMGNMRLVIFPNNYKGNNPKAPDYKWYLEAKEKQEPKPAPQQPQQQSIDFTFDAPTFDPNDEVPF